jgi:hypothetical protein
MTPEQAKLFAEFTQADSLTARNSAAQASALPSAAGSPA